MPSSLRNGWTPKSSVRHAKLPSRSSHQEREKKKKRKTKTKNDLASLFDNIPLIKKAYRIAIIIKSSNYNI